MAGKASTPDNPFGEDGLAPSSSGPRWSARSASADSRWAASDRPLQSTHEACCRLGPPRIGAHAGAGGGSSSALAEGWWLGARLESWRVGALADRTAAMGAVDVVLVGSGRAGLGTRRAEVME
jgi:hypothetical protein